MSGILCAAILVFLIPFFNNLTARGRFFLLTIVILGSIILILSNSRAGWIGFFISFSFFIVINIKGKQRTKLFLFVLLIISLLFLFLFFYKKDSSLGRIHIYRISSEMLKGNLVHGVGLGSFKAQFNEYQADYFFAQSIDNKRALLADNTFFAFNDYLQWVIETGVFGLIILLVLLLITHKRVKWLQNAGAKRPIVLAASSSLICVATAALFSYPLQVRVIQGFVLFCLGVIAFYPAKEIKLNFWKRFVTVGLQLIIATLTVLFLDNVVVDIKRKKIAKEAFELANSGYRKEAISKYKRLVELYSNWGFYHFLYAEQLYYTNQLPQALEILQKGKQHYVDNRVYKLKADIEFELGMYNAAEASYLRTIYMVPNRMGSRFDLLNFYVNLNDTSSAIYWSNSILNMPIKVPTERVNSILNQTRRILKLIKK